MLKDSATQFDAAFTAALTTPTHANILRRSEAQAATVKLLREFVNQFLRFPPVTNPDRADMGIRDAPPASPDELEHHTMASRTPFTLHFDEAERGKTVYVGLAWQNERGILGAYSEYKTAVVP